VILSTHVLPEVTATCQRIIIINAGRIVAEDTLEGLSRRMSPSLKFYARVRRPQQQLKDELSKMRGVRMVKTHDGLTFEVEADKDESICEQIPEAIVKSGAGLLEFKGLDVSLEDIFLKLTTSDVSKEVRA
jgi:ABC-2 type transport system ATP-binding protein